MASSDLRNAWWDSPRRLGLRVVSFFEGACADFISWTWLTLIIGAALGLSVWQLTHRWALFYVINGKLPIGTRQRIFTATTYGVVAVLGLYVLGHCLKRRGNPALTFSECAGRFNRYAFVVLSFPLAIGLSAFRMETQHGFLTLFLAATVGAFAGVFEYRLPPLALSPRWRRVFASVWFPVAVLSTLFSIYVVVVSHFAILDHHNLDTGMYDLGIYDNVMWNTIKGNLLGCSLCRGGVHMSAHFDPILFLLAPFYAASPQVETLLIAQTVWLASGLVPFYLLVKQRLKSVGLGLMGATIYFLYPHLHGVNLFDFHSLALVIPILLWVVYLLDNGGGRWYWASLALLLLTREDMALVGCLVGSYALLRRQNLTGAATIALSLAWLIFVKKYLMSSGLLMGDDPAASYAYQKFFVDLIPRANDGASDLLLNILANPVYALSYFFKPEKTFYFLATLMPLFCLPLFAGRKLILMGYGFLISAASSRPFMSSLYFQYCATLFPFVLASLPDGINRVAHWVSRISFADERRVVTSLMVACLIGTALTSLKFGLFFPNDAFRGGWSPVQRDGKPEFAERYEFVKQIQRYVGPDASVSAVHILVPHFSNRKQISRWPTPPDERYAQTEQLPDYVLLHSGARNKVSVMLTHRLVGARAGLEVYERRDLPERAELLQ